jgi:HPr kinase/phosphorylase
VSKAFTVLDLLDLDLRDLNALNLTCKAGRKGLSKPITQPDINRPGLALSGFFDDFNPKRLQLFGNGETAYLRKLSRETQWDTVEAIFRAGIPCCIFTNSYLPEERFLQLAEAHLVPVLLSDLNSSDFTVRIIRTLADVFAPQRTIHGVFVEVSGMGVLLTGDSGVGKSEAALELIERGHRLVCDDAVDIRNVSGNTLMGKPVNSTLGHHLEVRGIGIINVAQLFGVAAIQFQKEIDLVIELETWDPGKEYERLGTSEQTTEILGVSLPAMKIPVKPGRNIAILIETAVMNQRLKKMGFHSAQEFSQNVTQWLESENARAVYLRKTQENQFL